MDPPVELLHHHKKALHAKRSIGKYPQPTDSPTYDASEEDNDPLTDDAASAMSVPISRSNRHTNSTSHTNKSSSSRSRHQLAASLLSDDGTDSQTYDGDIESSATAGPDPHPSSHHHLHHASSVSTLTSPGDDGASSPSIPPASLSSSPVGRRTATFDKHHAPDEPKPTSAAEEAFNPAALTPEDIKAFVKKAIDGEPWRKYSINKCPTDRPVRIYADGVYDLFHFGHALQLRQAKLSFDNVHLLVGVSTSEDVESNKARCIMTHAERCEAVRHCRWVDEVISDPPWVVTAEFMDKWKIDYVAHDELPYMAEGYDDVYGFVKARGQFIPTRRTPGVSTSDLLERIVSGYRKRDFDKKLEIMGHAELKAEGSDFEDKSTRNSSQASSPRRRP